MRNKAISKSEKKVADKKEEPKPLLGADEPNPETLE